MIDCKIFTTCYVGIIVHMCIVRINLTANKELFIESKVVIFLKIILTHTTCLGIPTNVAGTVAVANTITNRDY